MFMRRETSGPSSILVNVTKKRGQVSSASSTFAATAILWRVSLERSRVQ